MYKYKYKVCYGKVWFHRTTMWVFVTYVATPP